ncbi:MAG: hypothetical protein WA888_06735 [Burkholderiaceae bacterium]
MRELKAITHLLKEHNAGFGAQKANKLLLAIGVLEEAERESNTSPGAVRKFKKISTAGEAYGENEWNDYGDAQPRFYSDTFAELLEKLNAANQSAS